tara:strand:+ start:1245 stop:1595 length:351 start_codon:yes stop_codon:yes gene_type:complete
MEAIELLRNKFGVSQKYKYEVKDGEETVLEIYWHPLTIAERESIMAKSKGDDANEFALNLMIEKALDNNGKKLFQDGHKASLRREVNSTVLQNIQMAMMTSGEDLKVEEAKAALKS